VTDKKKPSKDDGSSSTGSDKNLKVKLLVIEKSINRKPKR